jgi:transcriptional regulator with XRE-family HTH domain
MQHMKTEHSDFGDIDLKTLRTAYGLTQQAVAKEAEVNVHQVSLAERKKPISAYAKKRIDWWLEENTKVKP